MVGRAQPECATSMRRRRNCDSQPETADPPSSDHRRLFGRTGATDILSSIFQKRPHTRRILLPLRWATRAFCRVHALSVADRGLPAAASSASGFLGAVCLLRLPTKACPKCLVCILGRAVESAPLLNETPALSVSGSFVSSHFSLWQGLGAYAADSSEAMLAGLGRVSAWPCSLPCRLWVAGQSACRTPAHNVMADLRSVIQGWGHGRLKRLSFFQRASDASTQLLGPCSMKAPAGPNMGAEIGPEGYSRRIRPSSAAIRQRR